jgi:histidine ammonia-lyase
VREHVEHLESDRNISDDIHAAIELVRSGKLVAAVEDQIGVL